MRLTCMLICSTLIGVSSAQASMTRAEADRLREATEVLTSLRATPDHDIPQDVANRADCVMVIPGVKKAAFVFGGEYGKGVMSCRTATGWSAPAFMRLAKGSWGFQIGAEEGDIVLLAMNKSGVDKLLKDKVSLGGDVSVAAGPVGRTAQAATDAQLRAELLSYSRSRGLFAGVDISGGVLGPDEDANKDAYGPDSPREIIDGKAKTPTEAKAFMSAVRDEFGIAQPAPSAKRSF
jgi:lipid-binding SYLF domain-containing protein